VDEVEPQPEDSVLAFLADHGVVGWAASSDGQTGVVTLELQWENQGWAERVRHEFGDTVHIEIWPEGVRYAPPLRPLFVSEGLIERTTALVAHDLWITIGWRPAKAEHFVRRAAWNQASLDVWGDDLELTFPLVVAEDVQQQLHDAFAHTTWPPCPMHHRHPLWLDPEESALPSWRCPADGATYGKLGSLSPETPRR
jgi:hypothetical protein